MANRFGKENSNWKGGKTIDVRGYVLLNFDGKQVLEHRHVMSKHLGRSLTPQETVHHRNGNKQDNKSISLELMTKSTHMRLHMTGVKRSPETRRKMSVSAAIARKKRK